MDNIERVYYPLRTRAELINYRIKFFPNLAYILKKISFLIKGDPNEHDETQRDLRRH